jgi:hypothetical protein
VPVCKNNKTALILSVTFIWSHPWVGLKGLWLTHKTVFITSIHVAKHYRFGSRMVTFPARNANIYNICELHRAIFSSFYNILQPDFAILLILRCSFHAAMVMVSSFLSRSKFRLGVTFKNWIEMSWNNCNNHTISQIFLNWQKFVILSNIHFFPAY